LPTWRRPFSTGAWTASCGTETANVAVRKGRVLPVTSTCSMWPFGTLPRRFRSKALALAHPTWALFSAFQGKRTPAGEQARWVPFVLARPLALRPPGDGVGGYLPNGGPGSQGYDVYTPDSRPRGEAQPAPREGRAPSPSASGRRGVSASPSPSAPSMGSGPHPWPATQGWK
jgi:hypothetical protein